MLCCGLVALVVAGLASVWRRLRHVSFVCLGMSFVLFAVAPIIALAMSVPDDPTMSRGDVVAASLRSICGDHAGMAVRRPTGG
ncbi:hypothetical protein ACVWZA_004255 [Sphingomonas sp. UYAg733]